MSQLCSEPVEDNCAFVYAFQSTAVVTGTQTQIHPPLTWSLSESALQWLSPVGWPNQLQHHFKDNLQRFSFCWSFSCLYPCPQMLNSCLQHYLSFSRGSSYFSQNCAATFTITCCRSCSLGNSTTIQWRVQMLLKYILKGLFHVITIHTYKGKKKIGDPVSGCKVSRLNKWTLCETVSPSIDLSPGLDTAVTFEADDTNQSCFQVWSRGSWQVSFQVVHIRPPAKHKQPLPECDQRGCFPHMASFQSYQGFFQYIYFFN